MEECLVCFEETKETDFVVFSCKHRICKDCIPNLFMYSNLCPVCENKLTVYVTSPRPISCCNKETCKIFGYVTVISFGIFYIVNFVFKN